jgi:hypothetical protein
MLIDLYIHTHFFDSTWTWKREEVICIYDYHILRKDLRQLVPQVHAVFQILAS